MNDQTQVISANVNFSYFALNTNPVVYARDNQGRKIIDQMSIPDLKALIAFRLAQNDNTLAEAFTEFEAALVDELGKEQAEQAAINSAQAMVTAAQAVVASAQAQLATDQAATPTVDPQAIANDQVAVANAQAVLTTAKAALTAAQVAAAPGTTSRNSQGAMPGQMAGMARVIRPRIPLQK